ncbi:MAG: D-TA family PLP-dependent enzyme [Beijerinckiaceae bacterium]
MSDLKTKIARDFSTPCVVIDMDRVERNISRTQSLCDAAGVRNRPHIKTHKSPFLARMQVEAGASGVTCQKIGEAEVMANGGLNDILIAYNLLGEEKMARLGRLHERVDVTVAADNLTVIDGLSQAGEIAGRPLGVVIECDTGRKRAGVETAGEAIALAREVAKRPHLDFRGLMFYPTEKSWPETQAFLNEVKKGLQPDGLAEKIRIVSTGGSPNLANLGKLAGATEHRAGTSIFNDRMQMAAGVASLDDCALMVYATVVSRAGPERGILDSGSKTLTSDSGGLDGYGLILEHPQARIAGFSEEHGNLDLVGVNDKPKVGDVVRIVPNHVCVVVNMVDRLVMVRGDEIVGELPVVARGRLT